MRAGHVDRALERAGLHGDLARDGALALGWALVSAGVAALALGPVAARLGVPVGPTEREILLVLVVAQAAVLCLRRVRPVVCLGLVVLLQIVIAAVLPEQTILRAAPTLVVAYTLGTQLDRRRLGALVGAAALELLAQGALDIWPTPALRAPLTAPRTTLPGQLPESVWLVVQASNLVLVYATPALAGVLVSARHHRMQLLEDREAAAWGEHEALAAVAVSAERARMARELHDVAAHHLSGLLVQAAAAERLVGRDPEAARLAIATLRAEGREALASLRSMVGVLRDRGPTTEELAAPVPGVAGLGALLDRSRAVGDAIELTCDGETGELTTVADVAVYRVLQEALANARQHAPGQPVSVLVRQTATTLLLRVGNPLASDRPPPAAPSGFGLVGMVERSALAGGHVDAGPTHDGRWQVELVVPAARSTTAAGSFGAPAGELSP